MQLVRIGLQVSKGLCCCAQAKNPSRDLPIAILGSLSVATILYILMALAITMMVSIPRVQWTAPIVLKFAHKAQCSEDGAGTAQKEHSVHTSRTPRISIGRQATKTGSQSCGASINVIHKCFLALQIPYYLIDVGAPFSAAFRLIPGWHWVSYLVRLHMSGTPFAPQGAHVHGTPLELPCHQQTLLCCFVGIPGTALVCCHTLSVRTKAETYMQVSAGAVCSLFTVLLVRAPHTFRAVPVFLPHQ